LKYEKNTQIIDLRKLRTIGSHFGRHIDFHVPIKN